MNYESADRELHHKGHGGSMNSRKIQRNTYLERLGTTLGCDTIGLLLHYTYVAKFLSDGSVILDSGGWKTATTKDRLHRVSGWVVFSRRQTKRAESYWWLLPTGEGMWDTPPDKWVPFFDGIRVHQETGAVLSSDEEIEQQLEFRRPEPSKSELVKNYLNFVLDPDSMATFATDWKVAPNDTPALQDTASWLKHRPALTARQLLEHRHFDMGVAMKAIELDIAVRGEFDRSAHWEAMEWAQEMGEGKEPKHFRSTMRRLISYSLENA